MIHEKIQQVHDTAHDEHKGDRAKQLLYSQLPYHPQRVWAGSQFDAILREPLRLPVAAASAPMPAAASVDLTNGTLQARSPAASAPSWQSRAIPSPLCWSGHSAIRKDK